MIGTTKTRARAESANAGAQPGPELLIQGIAAEAEKKAMAKEQAAKDYALSRIASAESTAEAIKAEAAETARAREEEIAREAEARLALERRKLELDSEERFARAILAKAAEVFKAAAREPDYPDRVFAWICEAAIGLGTEAAYIEASEAERPFLSPAFLSKAVATVERLWGGALKLGLSESASAIPQGVILTAEAGRIAYDNSGPARLERAEPAMRALIREALHAARAAGQEGKNP